MAVIAGLAEQDKLDLKDACLFHRVETQQEWVRMKLDEDIQKMKEADYVRKYGSENSNPE